MYQSGREQNCGLLPPRLASCYLFFKAGGKEQAGSSWALLL